MFHDTIKPFGSSPQLAVDGPLPGDHFTNGPSLPPRFSTVTAALLHFIHTIPNEVAAIDHTERPRPRQISYAELGCRSRRLAHCLRRAGVGHGDTVPLVVRRGIDMVVGITAILLCGGQYVPIDGGVAPRGTLQRVIEQSTAKAIVCLRSTLHRLDELELGGAQAIVVDDEEVTGGLATDDSGGTEMVLGESPTAESGCYIIYTSGTSTEQPPPRKHIVEGSLLI